MTYTDPQGNIYEADLPSSTITCTTPAGFRGRAYTATLARDAAQAKQHEARKSYITLKAPESQSAEDKAYWQNRANKLLGQPVNIG